MSDEYTPPEVWTWDAESGGRFANINRPIAGATHEEDLPKGEHDLQLYSLATPNGVKVTLMLEELLELGVGELEADVAGADDGDPVGHPLQLERLVRREHRLPVGLDARRHEGDRSGRKDHVLGSDRLAGTDERDHGLAAIAPMLDALPGRRVVLGDFNATPWNDAFQAMRRECGLSAGSTRWWLPSWPDPLPGLLRVPIDHVLVGGDLTVVEARLGPSIGSDHRPVLATILVGR